MATSRFKATIDAIKGGLNDFSIDKAVKNIEGWEEFLGKHEQAAVKAVVQDLGKLKKLLQTDEIDSEAVQKLLTKVGKDTVKVGGDGKTAEQKHIQELGETLTDAADQDLDSADEDEDSDEEEDLDESEPEDEAEDLGGNDEETDDEDEVKTEEKPSAPAKKAAKKTSAKNKK